MRAGVVATALACSGAVGLSTPAAASATDSPAELSGVTPTSVSGCGGDELVVSGSGFGSPSAPVVDVLVIASSESSFDMMSATVVDDVTLTAITPPRPAGGHVLALLDASGSVTSTVDIDVTACVTEPEEPPAEEPPAEEPPAEEPPAEEPPAEEPPAEEPPAEEPPAEEPPAPVVPTVTALSTTVLPACGNSVFDVFGTGFLDGDGNQTFATVATATTAADFVTYPIVPGSVTESSFQVSTVERTPGDFFFLLIDNNGMAAAAVDVHVEPCVVASATLSGLVLQTSTGRPTAFERELQQNRRAFDLAPGRWGPVSDAQVCLVSDSDQLCVAADMNGQFTVDAYPGTYTVTVNGQPQDSVTLDADTSTSTNVYI